MRILLAVLVALTTLSAAPAVAAPVRPLPQAHAHNDYEHAGPLFDALDNGFTSVEADIYLVDGWLLVGHDPADLRPERTLQALYLDPLRDRVLANHGAVYQGRRVLFQLLVDIKNNGAATYTALDRVLRDPRYSFLFTRYTFGHVWRGPVTAVISGDRPRALMEGQRDRLAFYDGRIADRTDLGVGSDARLTPLVSDNWTALFPWVGDGPMPADQRAELRTIVRTAHEAGQRVRFWATPDAAGPARDAVWRELRAAGVDHLNTDNLTALAAFLRR
jgi:hypothetical protein